MIVADTNVVSELMRSKPDRIVVRCAASHAFMDVFTTSITRAEILFGLALRPEGKCKRDLESRIEQSFDTDFHDRFLSFDDAAAPLYADFAATRLRNRLHVSPLDLQIGAIAQSHGAALARRNVRDFEACDIELINPWEM